MPPARSRAWVMVLGGVAVGLGFASPSCTADCLDDAARYQRVHPVLLRAIAFHESGMRASAIGRNTNHTFDIGLMQINSIHYTELRSLGITPTMLLDPCVNAYVGAWHLRRKIDQHGNTWKAVGAYHSENPALGGAFAAQIQRLLRRWGIRP